LHGSHLSIVVNEHFEEDGAIVFREACKLGCEGVVSKRLGSPYRSGRSAHWVKVKNPNAQQSNARPRRIGENRVSRMIFEQMAKRLYDQSSFESAALPRR
jgi:ATP-dependent DNA ligase